MCSKAAAKFKTKFFMVKSGTETRKPHSKQQVMFTPETSRHAGETAEWTNLSLSVPWAVSPGE